MSAQSRHGSAAVVASILLACSARTQIEDTQADPFRAASSRWVPVAPMHYARQAPMIRLLNDGRVIVAGGVLIHSGDVTDLTTTEIYDPVANKWQDGADMTRSRAFMTLLPDGTPMAWGGIGVTDFDSADLLDPITNATRMLSPPKGCRFSGGTAVVLVNGKFLIPVQCGDAFRPAILDADHWALGEAWPIDPGSMRVLPSKRILLIGVRRAGDTGGSPDCYIYDPYTETLTKTDTMSREPSGHIVALNDGRVFSLNIYPATHGEIFDEHSETWARVADLVGTTIAPFQSGILVVDGRTPPDQFGYHAALYSPQFDAWYTTPPMNEQRIGDAAAVQLTDGRVLVVGGQNALPNGQTASAEVYVPGTL